MRIFILSIIASLFVLPIYAQDEEATTKIQIGQQIPEFSFTNENGENTSISEYKGKLIMVTFFATWCGPCRQELPHIQTEIFDRYKNNPQFKLLIFGREHSLKEVNDFKTAQNFTMPFYPDKDRSIYSLFAEKYIPRNFLIDTNGKIIYSEVGFNEEKFAELKNMINKKLGK